MWKLSTCISLSCCRPMAVFCEGSSSEPQSILGHRSLQSVLALHTLHEPNVVLCRTLRSVMMQPPLRTSKDAEPGLRQTRWCKDGRQLQDLGQRHSNGQQFQHHRQRHQASENRWLLLQIVLFIRANKWRDNILVNTKIWVILIYRFIEKLTLCSLKLFMHASNGYMNLIILYSH